jgi:hypothetical protein
VARVDVNGRRPVRGQPFLRLTWIYEPCDERIRDRRHIMIRLKHWLMATAALVVLIAAEARLKRLNYM